MKSNLGLSDKDLLNYLWGKSISDFVSNNPNTVTVRYPTQQLI